MKIMTYNIHSCIDMQKKNSLSRIAGLIRQERPAVVGLNEAECFSPRTCFVNQPKRLAAARNMMYSYGPTIKLGPIGFFGNAVLSRYPIVEMKNFALPSKREPRCCLRTVLRTSNGYITVFSTHLGLNREQRFKQIDELVRLVRTEKNPVILMGDFNCGTDQLAPLSELLQDTGAMFGSKLTYPFDKPVDRIDYILVSRDIACKEVYIPFNDASDHLPVIADLELPR